MGTGQICTKTIMHEGTKMHEDNFARADNFSRVTILHGDNFAQNNTNKG